MAKRIGLQRRLSALALTVFICSLPAYLRADSVAYINAGGGTIDYLVADGHNVTYINNPIGLTLADLSGFNAVVVSSNSEFSDPNTIGNVLAEFANEGGGVVLTEFDFQGQWQLGGAIMTPGYSPFTVDPSSTFSEYAAASALGTVDIPSSPLFNGVTISNVRTAFQGNVGLTPGATLVASWSTGRPAFAYTDLGNSYVVGLNLFGGDGFGSDDNADTNLVLSNAIDLSEESGVPTIPEPASIFLLGTVSFFTLTALRRKLAA